jgi:predicted Fe-S protein YdhL (DUF1289 family)
MDFRRANGYGKRLASGRLTGTCGDSLSALRMNLDAMSVPSPCTGICTMDETLGWCRGCGRSDEEIAEWHSAEDSRRAAIWALLPERADALGIAITRLPWGHGRIAEFVAESLDKKTGRWTVGCHGARVEFMCSADEPCGVSVSGNRITALSKRGALQLTIGETVRALQLRSVHARSGFRAIFLVVSKAKVMAHLPVASELTPLGHDAGALRPEGCNEHWYDLGLGRADLRLCIRTADSELQETLNRAAGLPLTELLQSAAPGDLTHRPTTIFESLIGRAEIFPSHFPSEERLLDGPRSFFAPQDLASGRITPPGIDLPPVYALGAAFYPSACGARTDFWPYGFDSKFQHA